MTPAHKTLTTIMDSKKTLRNSSEFFGSLSTVVGDEKLCARENDFRSLSLYVQSDENFGSKVLKVTKAKRLPFDVFDKLVSGFEFGVGIRLLQSVGDIGLVL